MSKDTLTFDNRAAQVKKTLAQYKGMPEVQVAEGFISAEQIRTNILTDMKSFVKQVEMLRAGSKDRKAIDVSLAQVAHRKYGFKFDVIIGSSDSFIETVGIGSSIHTLEYLFSGPTFEEKQI